MKTEILQLPDTHNYVWKYTTCISHYFFAWHHSRVINNHRKPLSFSTSDTLTALRTSKLSLPAKVTWLLICLPLNLALLYVTAAKCVLAAQFIIHYS